MKKRESKSVWANRIVHHGEQPADQFLAHELNARRHPAKQRDALRGSLDAVGWIDPVKVSHRTGKILDGHARIEEALSRDDRMLVPFVEVDVTEEEESFILATYDPITGLATYDPKALELLLKDVSMGDAAIRQMLDELAASNGVEFDKPIGAGGDEFDTTPDEEQTRVMYGDLWQCGEHRVLCGDSTKAEDVGRVTEGIKAVACITDPPYNVDIDYGTSTDDDRPYLEYLSWSKRWFVLAKEYVDFCVVLTTGITNLPMWIADIERTHRIISWIKQNQCSRNYIGETSGFNCWEPILVYGKSKKCVARDCFDIPIHLQADAEGHPCPKSIKAWIWLVENFSDKGDLLFEPFGGAGTTLIASERLGRKCHTIEISPEYVNIILSRWEAETGKQAQLLERISR